MARWLDVATGRFTQRDPWPGSIRQPQTRNGWSYADDNPVNLVDPSGLYSIAEIKEIFGVSFYDPDVLEYFEYGQPLEGRWGWLQVLRKAENGDRLIVFKKQCLGCWDGIETEYGVVHGCLWGSDLPPEDFGIFQKAGSELSIGGLPHIEVALEGFRYQIHKVTHCVPAPYHPGEEVCSPIIQHWEWKANVAATYRYMGLRRDPALINYPRAVASLASIGIPLILEESGELIALVIETVDATAAEGVEAGMDTAYQESIQLSTQIIAT